MAEKFKPNFCPPHLSSMPNSIFGKMITWPNKMSARWPESRCGCLGALIKQLILEVFGDNGAFIWFHLREEELVQDGG